MLGVDAAAAHQPVDDHEVAVVLEVVAALDDAGDRIDRQQREAVDFAVHRLRHERGRHVQVVRSEEHTSELKSLMRISYAVFCLKKKKNHNKTPTLQTASQRKNRNDK